MGKSRRETNKKGKEEREADQSDRRNMIGCKRRIEKGGREGGRGREGYRNIETEK